MELTDAIKNRCFETILDTHLWKTSIEYTALATLKFCFGKKYSGLRKAESPDLQDAENSVAIEVTCSVTPNDAQIIGAFTKIRQANSEKEKAKCRQKIVERGALLDDFGVMIWPVRRPENEKNELISAFIQKLEKVSEYRKKGFHKIGLLIYHEKPLFPSTKCEFSGWLIQAQEKKVDRFDFVYVLHTNGVLFYDFTTGEKRHTTISDEDMCTLNKLGRMAAEGEITDDDPLWQ